MKVALVYHESAGDGLEHDALVRAIEANGHQVLSIATPEDDDHRLEETGADLVVAAGGDGTIACVARALAHHPGMPLAILPLGTANNIATSLGIEGKPEELVAGWDMASRRAIDLGLGTGPWGERRVVESLGGGLVTHVTVTMDRRPSAVGPRDGELARALRTYRDVLPQLATCRWQLRIDDDEVEGDFLLVEALNTSHIGPNLCLNSSVRPDDGYFSVVMAERSHRKAIAAYLDARIEGRTAVLDLPVRRAERIEILEGDRLHLDDEIVGEAEGPGVKLTIERGVVQAIGTSHRRQTLP